MSKRRVLLLSEQDLLGESLEHLLSSLPEVELVGSRNLDDVTLEGLSACAPDLLLIAREEPTDKHLASLTAQVLEIYPNLPIIRLELEHNVLRIYTSQTLPARTADLVEAIRRLPAAAGEP
jgi:chemotaxis response regulator CheB